jgi:hypothetical protein
VSDNSRAAGAAAITVVLWFGLYMITLNWGEREVDAGTAAMIITIGPVLIALFGAWLLREGFPRRLGAGMAVSVAGVLVDHAGLLHLGLRPRADYLGEDGRHHLRGSRPGRRHVVAHPRSGAPVAHPRRRRPVPGRRRRFPFPTGPGGPPRT